MRVVLKTIKNNRDVRTGAHLNKKSLRYFRDEINTKANEGKHILGEFKYFRFDHEVGSKKVRGEEGYKKASTIDLSRVCLKINKAKVKKNKLVADIELIGSKKAEALETLLSTTKDTYFGLRAFYSSSLSKKHNIKREFKNLIAFDLIVKGKKDKK